MSDWYDLERNAIKNDTDPISLLKRIAGYLLMIIQDTDERERIRKELG